MIPIILVSKFVLLVVIDILPFKGSTLSLLVIAFIAVIALAIFRFLVPLIIAGIIVILLLVLIFGGIPISISK
ncbi:hypothetical protein DYY66_1570 [Candidatus Nitrosotalea sp. FS]|nr:hypothetical protein [Candidatus Nitrosotalea sp. FS]